MAQEVRCPKCGSRQINANPRGFSIGKAAAGTIIMGPIGALAGAHGSAVVYITCLSCGTKWNPKVEHEKQRYSQTVQDLQSTPFGTELWHKEFMQAYESGDRHWANNVLRLNSIEDFKKKGIDQVYSELPRHGSNLTTKANPDFNVYTLIIIVTLVGMFLLFVINYYSS